MGLTISSTALEKRWKAGEPLVHFLKQALEHALQRVVGAQPDCAKLLNDFTAVFVGDSSVVTLPTELSEQYAGCGGSEKASKAALKLHVLWDLKTGCIKQLQITDGKTSDSKSAIAQTDFIEPEALLLLDLGYFDLERFSQIQQQDAYYISRLQYGTGVYNTQQEALDVLHFLKTQSENVVDVTVLIGATLHLAVRMLAIRVPEETANRRRHKAKPKARSAGRTCRAHYLELLGGLFS